MVVSQPLQCFTERQLTRLLSFYINLPCGAVAALSIFLFFQVPESVKPAEATFTEKLLQMDLLGFVSITASVLCYLLALQWAGIEKRWSSSEIIGLLIGFGVFLIIFIVNERWQGKRALLLPAILKDYTISSGCVFCFL